jgi:nucleoid DNA-binding protein
VRLYVNRANLRDLVHRKIRNQLSDHIEAVISILFEEMMKDWEVGKSTKIHHFGTIKLKYLPGRHHWNVRLQKLVLSPGHNIMRWVMFRSLRQKLYRALDIESLEDYVSKK